MSVEKYFDSERGLGMQYRYWETLKIGMAVVMKETPFSGTKIFDDILGIFALYLLSKGILAHLSLLPSIGWVPYPSLLLSSRNSETTT